jgi:hypothetical protein
VGLAASASETRNTNLHSLGRIRRLGSVGAIHIERTMKLLLFLLSTLATAALLDTSAEAQNYPWCAQYSGGAGAMNCGFTSFQQFLADVSGIGGFCIQNKYISTSSGPRAQST